jgi:hypothetical protein
MAECLRIDPMLLEAIVRPGLIIAAGPDRVRLRWHGEAGTTYQVQYADSLDGPWIEGPAYAGAGELLVHTGCEAGACPHGFYRILAW